LLALPFSHTTGGDNAAFSFFSLDPLWRPLVVAVFGSGGLLPSVLD